YLGDRVGKTLIQSYESNYRTNRHSRPSIDAKDCSQNSYQRIADPSDICVDRHQQVGVSVCFIRTVSQFLIYFMELVHGCLLMAEHLNNLLAIQHLFNESIHSTQIDLLADIIFS